MFIVHYWRYHKKYEEEYETYEEAKNFFEADTDEYFAEKITDEYGNVVDDNMEHVIR
ncbi:hypothetical protein MHI49_28555 [Bacillus sp. FSL M7-0884]|uniref:hypothetical protein n=1 Tax=Bacillus sp. FSL M7-0884 TaxID=2921537 RepID=UPI0030FB3876